MYGVFMNYIALGLAPIGWKGRPLKLLKALECMVEFVSPFFSGSCLSDGLILRVSGVGAIG